MADMTAGEATVEKRRAGGTRIYAVMQDGKRVDGFLSRGKANRKAAELNRQRALAEPVWQKESLANVGIAAANEARDKAAAIRQEAHDKARAAIAANSERSKRDPL